MCGVSRGGEGLKEVVRDHPCALDVRRLTWLGARLGTVEGQVLGARVGRVEGKRVGPCLTTWLQKEEE